MTRQVVRRGYYNEFEATVRTIDRFGGRPVDAGFEEELRTHLERYRMAGQDLEVDGPRYVSLEVEIEEVFGQTATCRVAL